ncbi:hypothetical protein Tco_0894874 [Tanacetum coccineum]|uniref:Uncharacterized protein n=1 Tax=Tanacetum coccineum TaxID=301880 RepID=A0ABQ5CEE6_9ASTR
MEASHRSITSLSNEYPRYEGSKAALFRNKVLQHLDRCYILQYYPLQRFKSFFYDDDDDYDYEKSIISLNEIDFQIPPSIAITPVLEPEDSLIKSSVEDLVTIPSQSEDTSGSDSECILPSCDDFSPINVSEEKFVTFSIPLFDLNDYFASSDDESLSDEDIPEDNVKIYSNPLFKFDDEYISSDVNPLFDEVLENIVSKDSYVSNLDEPALLVTPLSDFNKDECFDPGGDVDKIEFLLHRDPSTPKLSVASILEGFTDEPPLEENEDLFDLESKENEWKKILYDAPIDDLMTEDKVFDLGIHKKTFSPTYAKALKAKNLKLQQGQRSLLDEYVEDSVVHTDSLATLLFIRNIEKQAQHCLAFTSSDNQGCKLDGDGRHEGSKDVDYVSEKLHSSHLGVGVADNTYTNDGNV